MHSVHGLRNALSWRARIDVEPIGALHSCPKDHSMPQDSNHHSIKIALIIPGLIAGISAPTAAQPRYTFHDLGTLGGSSSQATGINNSGQAAGSAQTGG